MSRPKIIHYIPIDRRQPRYRYKYYYRNTTCVSCCIPQTFDAEGATCCLPPKVEGKVRQGFSHFFFKRLLLFSNSSYEAKINHPDGHLPIANTSEYFGTFSRGPTLDLLQSKPSA